VEKSEKAESQPLDLFLSPLTKRATAIWAISFFAVAFAIRLIGIGWGLPNEIRHQSLHPDETINVLVANERPWFSPGFYNYGTLFFTVTKAGCEMGKTYGWVRAGESVEPWQTLGGLTATSRVVSALAGAATIAVVFLLLASITNLLGAAIGSIALVVAPGHLVHSRFATPDVFATLLIAVAALLIWRFMDADQSRKVRIAILLGVVIGLAAGTKYTGGLLLLSGWLAVWMSARESFVRLATTMLVVTMVGFFIATPGVLFESEPFWRDFRYELAHSAEGHGLVFANTPSGFIYHIVNLATAFGMFALLLSVIGLGMAVYKKEKWILPFLLFCIGYYVLIGRAEVKFVRYVFPLLPFLAVGFGYLVGKLHERSVYWRVVNIFAILAVGFSVRAENGAIPLTTLMMIDDPRDMTAKWMKDNAANERIGLVTDPWFYTPPLFPDTGLPGADARLSAMLEENRQLVRYIPPDGRRIEWDPRLITELSPGWVIISSFEFVDHDRVDQPDFVASMAVLSESYEIYAVAWGGKILQKSESQSELNQKKIDLRRAMRELFRERYPQLHDMMYIQPTVCVLRKKTD
jgi:hypothetical protein